MLKSFHSSDLEVLAAIFAADSPGLVVFDPGSSLKRNSATDFWYFTDFRGLKHFINRHPDQDFFLINLSTDNLDPLLSAHNVHSLVQQPALSPSNDYHFFCYINNPDGTIRWIFPESIKTPSYLNLYNSSSWRSDLYRRASSMLFKVGGKKWIASGNFAIRSKNTLQTDQLLKDFTYDHYSIFTGTISLSRKAILEVNKDGDSLWFLKLPIGNEAEKGLQNESEVLRGLNEMDLKYIRIPEVRMVGKKVLLENVKPSGFSNPTSIEALHLDALNELYEISSARKSLKTLSVFAEIKNHLEHLRDFSGTIESPFSSPQIKTVSQQLFQLWQKFQDQSTIPVALAHGDFTPWNMYCSENQLHLYDWEMARPEMPLLFDAFHFIFQSGVLIKGLSWDQISKELETLKYTSQTQEMIEKYNIDFIAHLQFYLLYTAAYYLPRYLHQQPLHQQAGWLVNIWQQALNTLVHIPAAGNLYPPVDFAKLAMNNRRG